MAVVTSKIVLLNRSVEIKVELDPSLPNEITAMHAIRTSGYYEPDVARALSRMIEPGDVAVDVGANIGLITVLMAALAGPKGRVISFEPGENNLPRLKHNIELGGFKNVALVEKPVTDAVGETVFYINNDNSGGNALWDPSAFSCNHEIPRRLAMQATTLDNEKALLGDAPKVLKIDTEGAEYHVLRGAQGYLKGRKIPFIIAEIHIFGLKEMKSSVRELREYMAQFGYEMFALYSSGCLPKFIPLKTEYLTPGVSNVLFSTTEQVAKIWPEDWFDPEVSPLPGTPKI
jgi:FkbM family methyltransferase